MAEKEDKSRSRPAPNSQVKRGRLTILALCLAGLFALGALITAQRLIEDRQFTDLQQKGQASAEIYREIIRGWLGRFRALAPIYAHNPEVIHLLRWPDDGIQIDLLNQRLEEWNAASGASATYLLNAEGTTIAASNWNDPDSFLNRNFAFRPYFQDAMQGRLGRYFALGTTSGKRGYYFAYPVRNDTKAFGVIVVKVPVDEIEQELRSSENAVFVTDRMGIIVLSGHPNWRLKTLHPLAEEDLAAIGARKQFNPEALTPAPIRITRNEQGLSLVNTVPDRSKAIDSEFLYLSEDMAVEGWTLHLLVPTAATRTSVLNQVLLIGAFCLLLILAGVILWQRQRRFMDRLAERRRAEAALERAVEERTADLQKTQNELVQAAKLAALGQMSTALSHEFNQPLAAVRSYAENATAFLDRGRTDQAKENLRRVSRLTERMARLSKHLTSFARKPRDTLRNVSLDLVIEETLTLLSARLERAEVQLENQVQPDLVLVAGQTRLQHVLMNLISNAIDAVAQNDNPLILLKTNILKDKVEVIVEDNGTGIPLDIQSKLFDPFFSTKETGKGLGLGLSITYNIIRDFGGSIRTESPGTGARFIVTLKQADGPAEIQR